MHARNKILGVEHPYTILALENLATTYGNLGNYAEAENLQKVVLARRNRQLGEQHPDTIRAMESLGTTYGNQRNYTEVEKLKVQVLNARNKLLAVENSTSHNILE